MEHFFSDNLVVFLLAGFSGFNLFKRSVHQVQLAFKATAAEMKD